jgi:hypothetical protein
MRLRREEPLDPIVARELEAIDRALRGDSVDGADPELAELGRLAFELRAERPVLEREFAAELDGLVRTGFAPAASKGTPAERQRRAPRPGLALAFGAAASIFITVTAVLSSGVVDSGDRPSTDGASRHDSISQPPGASERGAAGGTESASPALSSPAPRDRGLAPRARRREVERQASLTLAAPRGEVESVADDVIAITDRYRGFVLSSTVSGGDREEAASLDLRIPADRLQPALADLSELAHVRSRTQASLDVTGAVSSLRERLRDRLAERRSLLNRLERATTDNEATSLRARIRIVNRRIARARDAFREQRNRVDYSVVSVAVEADPNRAGDGSWSPGDALNDAWGILGTALAVALVTLAVLLPASLLLLLVLAGWHRGQRRLRERALEGS